MAVRHLRTHGCIILIIIFGLRLDGLILVLCLVWIPFSALGCCSPHGPHSPFISNFIWCCHALIVCWELIYWCLFVFVFFFYKAFYKYTKLMRKDRVCDLHLKLKFSSSILSWEIPKTKRIQTSWLGMLKIPHLGASAFSSGHVRI